MIVFFTISNFTKNIKWLFSYKYLENNHFFLETISLFSNRLKDNKYY